jgi:EAL domain-containing protein (putative c-di-GMP-specific phosphodiesterase class I)
VPSQSTRRPVDGPQFNPEEIIEGLRNNEFEPFYQPKVEIATGKAVGAEALARWCHPQQGMLPPSVFVKALEEAGKIDVLMRCMISKSAAFCRRLHNLGTAHTIAVNVSVRSLGNVKLADDITEIVRRQLVDPRCIVLEITESAATADVGSVLENLTRLRMKGFALAIDDYGTGYSSLEQLARIPFTELKIDQSFVTNAGRQESSKVILASSLEMARRLNIKAVAEGVETSANWDLLTELRCDIAQGYYISKPMSAAAYLEWLAAWPKLQSDFSAENGTQRSDDRRLAL